MPIGPARKTTWIVTTNGGTRLRVANDPNGNGLWPTNAEAAKAETEAANAREARALERIAELEALLAKK